MLLDQTTILLRRNLIEIPLENEKGNPQFVGTLLSNLAYYGFVPSKLVIEHLSNCLSEQLIQWWENIEPALMFASGDDKNIGDTIVYQNFPNEVLQMSEAEYWIKQIFMYLGVDKTLMRETPNARPKMLEELKLTVLHMANDKSLEGILHASLIKPANWIEQEIEEVKWFIAQGMDVDVNEIPFKENRVQACLFLMEQGKPFSLKTTTDILRFYAGISAGDIGLKIPTKFVSLARAKRKVLLGMLDQVADLEEGLMRHKKVWIKALHALHVGDYKSLFPRVYESAQVIRNGGAFKTFNGQLEKALLEKDKGAIDLLKARPGEFSRRLVHLVHLFGLEAVDAFKEVLSSLETMKLLRLVKVLSSYNTIRITAVAPKGNWTKMQRLERTLYLKEEFQNELVKAIRKEIDQRIKTQFPKGIKLGKQTDLIKLPTNNKEGVLPYGRGTVFPIPKHIKFLRSATFWQEEKGACWMDNGWNFFDKNWKPLGTTCWNVTDEMKPAAVFSGDPINIYNQGGKAGQLIDLYLDKLRKKNVAYAVWNILSYNHIAFGDLSSVMGLLLMGENPETGKLLEPSRCQFAFPLKGNSLTNYVCYIDLNKNELVYLDAGLYGKVSSAKSNETILSENMPTILNYIKTLPSVYDLFINSASDAGIPVLYSDKEVSISNGQAYVFSPENKENNFEALHVEDLIP